MKWLKKDLDFNGLTIDIVLFDSLCCLTAANNCCYLLPKSQNACIMEN